MESAKQKWCFHVGYFELSLNYCLGGIIVSQTNFNRPNLFLDFLNLDWIMRLHWSDDELL